MITCPAAVKLPGADASVTDRAGDVTAGTVAVDGPEVTGVTESGGVPWAVAVLDTLPASTSACVVV